MSAEPNTTVMIVEDDNDIRDSLQLALELEDYQVVTAENGKVALDKLKSVGGPCLILLDLMMPVMNGWEFMDHLKQKGVLKKYPIIVISAVSEQAQHPTAHAFVKKPVDLGKLLDLVHHLCKESAA